MKASKGFLERVRTHLLYGKPRILFRINMVSAFEKFPGPLEDTMWITGIDKTFIFFVTIQFILVFHDLCFSYMPYN